MNSCTKYFHSRSIHAIFLFRQRDAEWMREKDFHLLFLLLKKNEIQYKKKNRKFIFLFSDR